MLDKSAVNENIIGSEQAVNSEMLLRVFINAHRYISRCGCSMLFSRVGKQSELM